MDLSISVRNDGSRGVEKGSVMDSSLYPTPIVEDDVDIPAAVASDHPTLASTLLRSTSDEDTNFVFVTMIKIATTLLLAACAVGNTVAFVPNSNNGVKAAPSTTIVKDPLGLNAANIEGGEIPYGEESRKFRRTVYSHDDWVKHRSPDRFIKNILSTTKSGIYKVGLL